MLQKADPIGAEGPQNDAVYLTATQHTRTHTARIPLSQTAAPRGYAPRPAPTHSGAGPALHTMRWRDDLGWSQRRGGAVVTRGGSRVSHLPRVGRQRARLSSVSGAVRGTPPPRRAGPSGSETAQCTPDVTRTESARTVNGPGRSQSWTRLKSWPDPVPERPDNTAARPSREREARRWDGAGAELCGTGSGWTETMELINLTN